MRMGDVSAEDVACSGDVFAEVGRAARSAMAFPLPDIELCFSARGYRYPSPVSTFLGSPFSENTTRPLYCHAKRVSFAGHAYLAVYVAMFFAENPGYGGALAKAMPSRKEAFGWHEADVERLVLLYEEQENQGSQGSQGSQGGRERPSPSWVFFGAHGNGQGLWLPYDQCEKADDGRLRVYVASETSNALYPRKGRYWRAGGFANDVTRGGVSWRPEAWDFVHSGAQSWSLTHYQVRRGINSPLNVADPEARGIGAWARFFLLLPCVKKRVQSTPKVQVL